MLLQGEPRVAYCDQGQGCYLSEAGEATTCYGHSPRNFITECNFTCGCHVDCANKVVQRGMQVKVGVFWCGVKAWGVRTFEYIPKGSFVFEYVGEVCSNAKLLASHQITPTHGLFTLDLNADWQVEAEVTYEEALCIDGFRFGNVGRFLNHRCGEANLVDFPVRIEESDPHKYHVAFFAKRKICALEELTWTMEQLSGMNRVAKVVRVGGAIVEGRGWMAAQL